MKSSIRSGIGSKTYVDSEDLQKLEYTEQLPTSFCNCLFCQKGEWNSAHIHILFDKLRKYSYTVGKPLDGVYRYALLHVQLFMPYWNFEYTRAVISTVENVVSTLLTPPQACGPR